MPNIQYTTKIERVYTHEDSLSVSYRRPDDVGPTFIKVYYDQEMVDSGDVDTSEYIQSLIAAEAPLAYWAKNDIAKPEDLTSLLSAEPIINESDDIEASKTKIENIKDTVYELKADFSFEVDGLVVSFTETCVGLCDGHSWEFGFVGDESVGLPYTEDNPTVEFPSSGEYEVTHTAGNKHKREKVTKTVTIV
jgi:PKD repeat protein|tara:strand:- start:2721 stop:3296 length:576 start_codon:yes stop_codon:yes gene_type:complete